MNVDVSFNENALLNAIRRVAEATATKIDADREYQAAIEDLRKAILADNTLKGLVQINNIHEVA